MLVVDTPRHLSREAPVTHVGPALWRRRLPPDDVRPAPIPSHVRYCSQLDGPRPKPGCHEAHGISDAPRRLRVSSDPIGVSAGLGDNVPAGNPRGRKKSLVAPGFEAGPTIAVDASLLTHRIFVQSCSSGSNRTMCLCPALVKDLRAAEAENKAESRYVGVPSSRGPDLRSRMARRFRRAWAPRAAR